jgi:type II secretory ATPase GspE/PulE/Tfp pilus assembly ATPase PilB-like protein
MNIEKELKDIIKKAIRLNMRDIHFIVDYDVEIQFRSGVTMLLPDTYLPLYKYNSLIVYIKKNTKFESTDPKLPQLGTLVMSDEDNHLLTCYVSILPTKKHQLVLRIIQENKENDN